MRHKPEKQQENHEKYARLDTAPCQKLLIPIPLSHNICEMKLICKCPKKNGTTPRLHVNFFNGDTHCGVSERKKIENYPAVWTENCIFAAG
jgi:hypothetical protein